MKIIIIISILLIIISIYYVRFYKKKPRITASFKNAIKMVRVPVISFENNNQTFHFIIDSGASHSIININSIQNFIFKEKDGKSRVYGVDGNKIDSTSVIVELNKKGYNFVNEFQILPVGGFENIKNKHGIEISGLIGNDFLSKYEFIMDFKNLKYYIFKDETNLKRGLFKNIKEK